MARVLVGIPSIRQDQDLINSMKEFIPLLGKEPEVEVLIVRNKNVDEARIIIVDYLIEKGYEYLLFLDDDHSGHTMDMFNAMLNTKSYVSAIKCYRKGFPYIPNLLDYSGQTEERVKYKVKDIDEGIHFCDLVGFGMTLIKASVFDLIDKPYFVADNNGREDNYFCDKLVKIGIRPIGIFDYCLPHQGIDQEKAKELERQEIEKIIREIKSKEPDKDITNLVLIG